MSWIKLRWLFSSHFWLLLKQVQFCEADVAVGLIGSSLKPNHHYQKKVKLAQIRDTHCITTELKKCDEILDFFDESISVPSLFILNCFYADWKKSFKKSFHNNSNSNNNNSKKKGNIIEVTLLNFLYCHFSAVKLLSKGEGKKFRDIKENTMVRRQKLGAHSLMTSLSVSFRLLLHLFNELLIGYRQLTN